LDDGDTPTGIIFTVTNIITVKFKFFPESVTLDHRPVPILVHLVPVFRLSFFLAWFPLALCFSCGGLAPVGDCGT
jgi:hypothetical protein